MSYISTAASSLTEATPFVWMKSIISISARAWSPSCWAYIRSLSMRLDMEKKRRYFCHDPGQSLGEAAAASALSAAGICRFPRQVKPNGGAIFRFILDPLIPTLSIPVAGSVLAMLFPSWADFTYSIVWMAMVPCLWFLTVRFLDFFSSGIGRQGDMFTLRYSSGSQLHTVVLPRGGSLRSFLRQSPIQAFDRRCDVLIYSMSEKRPATISAIWTSHRLWRSSAVMKLAQPLLSATKNR